MGLVDGGFQINKSLWMPRILEPPWLFLDHVIKYLSYAYNIWKSSLEYFQLFKINYVKDLSVGDIF